MPNPQRYCIYCGGSGLTKEHLYAAWLREHISSRVDVHGISKSVIAPTSSSSRVEMRTGDTHSRKIRRVCANCNSGWMSQLQKEAKPFLVPMIRGDSISLSRQAQKKVSAWAAMFTMTSEFVDDEFVAIRQEDRDYLRTEGRVPVGWRIWIGRYQWARGIERWTHNVMALADDGFKGPAGELGHAMNTQTTTICVGNQLVIYVMSSAVGPGKRLIQKWRFPPPVAASLRQVHPAAAATARWPASRTLSARDVLWLANTFFKGLEFLMHRQMSGLV